MAIKREMRMAEEKRQDQARQEQRDKDRLIRLTNAAMYMTDKEGKALSKTDTRVSASVHMKLEKYGLKIKMFLSSCGMNNGCTSITLDFEGETVFHVLGGFMAYPIYLKAKIYKPGAWEEILDDWAQTNLKGNK